MNRLQAQNEFKGGLKTLIEDIKTGLSPEVLGANPYAGAGEQFVLEHTTRIFFFDHFLRLLGWELGLYGDVIEEARVKTETTTFIDYLGVNQGTRAPSLLVEAKAWEKPIISPRSNAGFKGSLQELLVAAVQHVNAGGAKINSPASAIWHDYLEQVRKYVCSLKEVHGHELPCAILSSGQWMIVFKSPIATFFDGDVKHEQFEVFSIDDYIKESDRLFDLLNRETLASIVPFSLRPSQLGGFVTAEQISAVFFGLHIKYESSGASLFAHQPRILVYPAVIILREDDVLLTAMDGSQSIEMTTKVLGNDQKESLTPHLDEVKEKANELLKECSDEMQMPLVPFDLFDFPGFPKSLERIDDSDKHIQVVKPYSRAADEWLYVTGTHTHYLMKSPRVHSCRFHAWADCRNTGSEIGTSAVNSPKTTSPRSFFTDSQIHHCAHQTVQDRRHDRCYIAAVDQRICCSTCIYQDLCWSPEEANNLPCGN